MKRLLAAALCQLAAAVGSSKYELRLGTINKAMSDTECICTCIFVHVCASGCVKLYIRTLYACIINLF